MYVVGTDYPQNMFLWTAEAILRSTHNMRFYGEL